MKDACDGAGIEFLCSAFSVEALGRLEQLGVRRHKIPSGEVTNLELIRAAAATGKPVFLSSGMSSWAELDAAVEAAGDDATVLQCTSAYPTPPERVGLNLLAELPLTPGHRNLPQSRPATAYVPIVVPRHGPEKIFVSIVATA